MKLETRAQRLRLVAIVFMVLGPGLLILAAASSKHFSGAAFFVGFIAFMLGFFMVLCVLVGGVYILGNWAFKTKDWANIQEELKK